jgi:hypothetical protein
MSIERVKVPKPFWQTFEVLLSVRFALLDTAELGEKRARFIAGKTEVWNMNNLSVPAKVLRVKAGKVRNA